MAAVGARPRSAGWVARYRRLTVAVDAACGLIAGAAALLVRFPATTPPDLYAAATAGLPLIWVAWVWMLGGYDPRFIGLGSEEFRRIINSAVSLTAAVAVLSYAFKLDFARGYVLLAIPGLGVLDMIARYAIRKHLHRQRARGLYMRRVTAVGHESAVADLIVRLRRDTYHGLQVVNACLPDRASRTEIEGVPVMGSFSDTAWVAGDTGADTVAVLSCPEMDGVTLRRLAWELEKERTDLCVAPASWTWRGRGPPSGPWRGCPCCTLTTPTSAGPSGR